jgi:hypothetical protein
MADQPLLSLASLPASNVKAPALIPPVADGPGRFDDLRPAATAARGYPPTHDGRRTQAKHDTTRGGARFDWRLIVS